MSDFLDPVNSARLAAQRDRTTALKQQYRSQRENPALGPATHAELIHAMSTTPKLSPKTTKSVARSLVPHEVRGMDAILADARQARLSATEMMEQNPRDAFLSVEMDIMTRNMAKQDYLEEGNRHEIPDRLSYVEFGLDESYEHLEASRGDTAGELRTELKKKREEEMVWISRERLPSGLSSPLKPNQRSPTRSQPTVMVQTALQEPAFNTVLGMPPASIAPPPQQLFNPPLGQPAYGGTCK